MRPATASTNALELVSAAFSGDMAAEAGVGAGKDVIVGLVECEGDESGRKANSLDCPRCRIGIGLAQIEEDDIGLCVGDLCDALRAQIDDVDRYDMSTAAQGGGQPIPHQMNRACDHEPNGHPDFRMRTPQCPCNGVFRHLRPPLGRVTRMAGILFVSLQYGYSGDYWGFLRECCKAARAPITTSSCGAS
jgi:hypothetical protein